MGGSHIEALQMNRSENVTHKLDEDNMNSVISGTYQGPELLSQKSNLASLVRNYIPASGQLILQLQNWEKMVVFEMMIQRRKMDLHYIMIPLIRRC